VCSVFCPTEAESRKALWKLTLSDAEINLLHAMAGGTSTTDIDLQLSTFLALNSTAGLLPTDDVSASVKGMFLAVANKAVAVDTMATKWMKYATVDTLNSIALNLPIACNSDHATLAESVFTHEKFKFCKDPEAVDPTKEARLAYLHKLSVTPIVTSPKPSATPPDLINLDELADKLAQAGQSKRKKRKLLQAQLKALDASDVDADDSSDSEDDSAKTGTSFTCDFSIFDLHQDDQALLTKGSFVSLAALHTGKGPHTGSKRAQRTLVIPTRSSAASAVLTIASQVVCQRKGCKEWAAPNFAYIQFIVSLYTFLTAAGVHEVDRLCRSYCCEHKLPWSVPSQIYHHVMCIMVGTCRSQITICTICGNPNCAADRCNFQQHSSSQNGSTNSSPSKTRKPPSKTGVCHDYNKGSCTRSNCKFDHTCSAPKCSKPHPWCKNH
jgi:hypothetical protein